MERIRTGHGSKEGEGIGREGEREKRLLSLRERGHRQGGRGTGKGGRERGGR